MNIPLLLMSVLALCLAAAVYAAELKGGRSSGPAEGPALSAPRSSWERSVRTRTLSEREVQGRAEALESRMSARASARRPSSVTYRGLGWLRGRSRS